MSDESNESILERAVSVLEAYCVRYLIIGGQAEYLFGSPRVTHDVDICYERTPQNLERLANALKDLHAKLRGAPPDVPFILDARTLQAGSNFTFETDIGAIDILGHVEPIGEFEDVNARAEEYEFGPYKVRTISLDDLIRIKQHIKRFKDSESLMQLLAIKRIRGEQQGAE